MKRPRAAPPQSFHSFNLSTTPMMNSFFAKCGVKLALLSLFLVAATAAADDQPCNRPPQSAIGADGWINLFNGKDLTGWKLGDAKQSKFHVEDGKIVAAGPRSHAFTDYEFKNFEFEAEVMTTPNSNSGIYFHTKYQESGFPNTGFETQVNCTHRDPVKTGSLYNLVRLYETPAKDNQWWKQSISVKGNRVVVKVNDKIVVDYEEPSGVKPGRNKLGCGSFALQAHDAGSKTYYRNLRVKPLPDELPRPTRTRRRRPAA